MYATGVSQEIGEILPSQAQVVCHPVGISLGNGGRETGIPLGRGVTDRAYILGRTSTQHGMCALSKYGKVMIVVGKIIDQRRVCIPGAPPSLLAFVVCAPAMPPGMAAFPAQRTRD